jgi:hypothetical protein
MLREHIRQAQCLCEDLRDWALQQTAVLNNFQGCGQLSCLQKAALGSSLSVNSSALFGSSLSTLVKLDLVKLPQYSWLLLCSVMSVVYIWFLCMTTHPLGYTMCAGARVFE